MVQLQIPSQFDENFLGQKIARMTSDFSEKQVIPANESSKI